MDYMKSRTDMMTQDTLNIALVEFSPVWESPAENLGTLDRVFTQIAGGALPLKPDLVVLPEFFAVGFTMNPDVAEPSDSSATLSWMENTASRFGCAVAGSVPVKSGRERYNRMFFVTPPVSGGKADADFYDKSYLFFGGEDANYSRGTLRGKVFSFRGWRILPGICFDMRFPELARNSGAEPYDLYLNVANWPVARNAAADILLKARSIENVCWSVFCNRTGADRLLEYSGNSAIIDYRGRSRGKRHTVEGVPVVCGTLEKAPMLRFRSGFPILDLVR